MSNKKHMQPFIKNPVTLEATTMYKVLMDTCPQTSIPKEIINLETWTLKCTYNWKDKLGLNLWPLF
jgi:hypothetical protein